MFAVSIIALAVAVAALAVGLYNRLVVDKKVGVAAQNVAQYVVDQTVVSLNDWAPKFQQAVEQTIDAKIAAATAPRTGRNAAAKK